MMDMSCDYYGAKSGKQLDPENMQQARELEIESMKRLGVFEPIALDEARRNKMEMVHTKWLDDEKPTASDPERIRSRQVAAQVNTYTRGDITQATLPIKA